jgi:hypothetical protein
MTNKIRLDVESGLHKIQRGGKPWSPKLQIYRDTIELWQQKLAGAFCMNDVKSCYDRIVHAPAALCMRHWQSVIASISSRDLLPWHSTVTLP